MVPLTKNQLTHSSDHYNDLQGLFIIPGPMSSTSDSSSETKGGSVQDQIYYTDKDESIGGEIVAAFDLFGVPPRLRVLRGKSTITHTLWYLCFINSMIQSRAIQLAW